MILPTQDTKISCMDCREDFVFTAGESRFYAEKGFEHAPSRCANCRAKRRIEAKGNGVTWESKCCKCSGKVILNFRPSKDRRVYCQNHLPKHSSANAGDAPRKKGGVKS